MYYALVHYPNLDKNADSWPSTEETTLISYRTSVSDCLSRKVRDTIGTIARRSSSTRKGMRRQDGWPMRCP